MENDKKRRILIISPLILPIPAVLGGAVETLITNFINQNEIEQKVDLFVVSIYNEQASQKRYKFAKILYIDAPFETPLIEVIIFNLKKCLYKLFHNRVTQALFKVKVNYYSFFSQKIVSIVKKAKPDAIICDGYNKLHNLWFLVKKIDRNNIFYHLHYCREEDVNMRELIPNTIAVSKYVLNKWQKTTSKLGKGFVVLNAVDVNNFERVNESQIKDLKEKYFFTDRNFVVIFVGRFNAGKGLVELLTGFSLLRDNRYRLLLLGDFSIPKNDRDIEFENNVKELILKDKRIIHVGFVPNEKTPLYYLCSDVQVIPSVYEDAAPLVSVEGMTASLPLIITKSGGLPEYVNPNCSIQLGIDSNLSNNIAASIEKIAHDSDMARKMSIESKKCSMNFGQKNYYYSILKCLFGDDYA